MSLLPQFGFFELITVAVIALVVVGPKDLPRLMRMAGGLVRQARGLAAEFTSAFDQMAREAELDEMRREIESLKNDNVFTEAKKSMEEAVAPIDKALRDEASELDSAVDKMDDQIKSSSDQTETENDTVDSDTGVSGSVARPQNAS